jgi:hypothetical protein
MFIFPITLIFLFFLLLNHDVLPLAGLIVLKLEVYLVDGARRVEVYPEVAVIEYRLHGIVGCIVDRILTAGRRLNKESLLDLSIPLL